MRSERDHKAALTVQKVPIVFHSSASKDLLSYMNYLTPYAYQYVQQQLSLKDKVKRHQPKDAFLISASEGEVTVTASSCTCMY